MIQHLRRNLLILPLCLTALSMSATSYADSAKEAEPADTNTEQAKADSKLLPLEDLRTFTQIFERIKQSYVEPVEDRDLLESAIRGMLSGLDPHSSYLEKEAFEDLEVNTRGEFGGLGIEVEMEDGFVRVITPIDDTPAIRAGIEPGDLIVKIDDKPIKGMSLQEAVELMRGKPGTDIMVTIIRDGENKPLEITVTRDIIKVTSVKHRTLEPGFGYIRVTQFQVNTGENLVKALKALRKKNKPLNGLVLDLRNNPGGVLTGAVEVSDAFLKEGLIVYTEGRMPNSELRYNATAEDPSQGIPLVVLINQGSASASEIVAGALQDHRRAVIMGAQSFGKGSVQTVLPLSNERALKLTTALYYTPNGRSIQAEGIVPDLKVERAKVTQVKNRSLAYKEADLKGHLTNGKKKKKKSKDKKHSKKDKNKKDEAPEDEMALAEKDFQLFEALNLLKGIHILSAGKSQQDEKNKEKDS